MRTHFPNVYVNPTMDEMAGSTVGYTPIAFDMDSVLLESGYFRPFIAKEFGVGTPDIRTTDPDHGYEKFNFEIPGVSEKEMIAVINKAVREESPSALPSPHMDDVLSWVYHITGKPVLVVTARCPSNAEVTHQWLYENITVPFVCYIMHGQKKHMPLHAHGVDIFVDDRFKTIKELRNHIHYPVLYKRPWNQGRPEKLHCLEIEDLRDIIPLLNISLGIRPMAWPHWCPYPKPREERKNVC